MLVIPGHIYRQMLDQARNAAPVEACGILAGEATVAREYYPMTNADASAEHFSLVPEEQFAVARAMRASGCAMVAVCHSHPATPPRPSDEDIRLAVAPGILHVILSLAADEPDIRAFRIEGGRVETVPVHIDGSLPHAPSP